MDYSENDFLMLSGLQHFSFCPRQWALIHIDNIWTENERTTEGKLLHETAHDSYRSESRGEVVISRSMPVFSHELGLSGSCDVVEFRRVRSGGVPISGKDGLWDIYPVEYKRGSPKDGDCDALQLAAQAMCLEEMLCCQIPVGALFYFETRRRQSITFDEGLREKVRSMSEEMHRYYDRRWLPKPKRTKSCNACSLRDECLPKLEKLQSAHDYNILHLGTLDDPFQKETDI